MLHFHVVVVAKIHTLSLYSPKANHKKISNYTSSFFDQRILFFSTIEHEVAFCGSNQALHVSCTDKPNLGARSNNATLGFFGQPRALTVHQRPVLNPIVYRYGRGIGINRLKPRWGFSVSIKLNL